MSDTPDLTHDFQPLTERERYPYLVAIEQAIPKPQLGEWDWPGMMQRLLDRYDAAESLASECARLRQQVDDLSVRYEDFKERNRQNDTRARAAEEALATLRLQVADGLKGLRPDWESLGNNLPEGERLMYECWEGAVRITARNLNINLDDNN